MSSQQAIKLSIVIPAFNEEEYLGDSLNWLELALTENADKGISWEMIVCDNNSGDHTAEIAQQHGARVVFEADNQISRARNIGAASAMGAWLLFIDADTYPSPPLLAEVFELIQQDEIIGCGTTIQVEGGTLLNKLRLERLNPIFRLLNCCGGAFLLCRTEAFHALGGFSQTLYALEEIEFVIRLKRYGRSSGRNFPILYRNPAITSGRKGDYHPVPLIRMFASNLIAVILFLLYFLLPKPWIAWLGARLLGYWYSGKR